MALFCTCKYTQTVRAALQFWISRHRNHIVCVFLPMHICNLRWSRARNYLHAFAFAPPRSALLTTNQSDVCASSFSMLFVVCIRWLCKNNLCIRRARPPSSLLHIYIYIYIVVAKEIASIICIKLLLFISRI